MFLWVKSFAFGLKQSGGVDWELKCSSEYNSHYLLILGLGITLLGTITYVYIVKADRQEKEVFVHGRDGTFPVVQEDF